VIFNTGNQPKFSMTSIHHVNINSITKHKDELLARFSNYDIISMNETNLKSE
jgi:hypothetical protein